MITAAQHRQRRRHIITVTLGMVRGGGYEAVTMRAVAERADIALATLYRYFPSKANLLLSVLESELDAVERKARFAVSDAADRYERLWLLIARLNAQMARDPRLAEAMARAFMAAYTANGQDADRIRHRLDAMFAQPLADGQPTLLQRRIAGIVVDAWVSNAFSWLNRRATSGDIDRRVWQLLAVLARRDGVAVPPREQPGHMSSSVFATRSYE